MKLEKICLFMVENRLLVFCLLETWRETPNGVEFEETKGGFLVIHHGEAAKPDGPGRARRGVSLVLSPETPRAWESGGSKFSHGTYGRVLKASIPLTGQRTWAVGGGYAPGRGGALGRAPGFYGGVAVRTESAVPRNIASFFADANAGPARGRWPLFWLSSACAT